jgi:hypothetical protein
MRRQPPVASSTEHSHHRHEWQELAVDRRKWRKMLKSIEIV